MFNRSSALKLNQDQNKIVEIYENQESNYC